MRLIWLTLLLAACGAPDEMMALDGAPMGDAGDPADSMVTDTDAGPSLVDAFVPPGEDAGPPPTPDAGEVPEDAGPAPLPDAGPPVDPCPGAAYDAPLGVCIYRMPHTSGPLCSSSFTPLEWSTVEDQRRLEALLAPMGPGGTGLLRSALGNWRFLPSGASPGSIEWAPGHPRGVESFSYFAADGMRTNNRAYSWQFCARPPL